jgi:hypothetical protein
MVPNRSLEGTSLPRPGAARRAALPPPLEPPGERDAEGRTPLQVMLGNMEFWERQTEAIGAQLDSLVVPDNDADAARAAADLVREFLAARREAQACARDAAPFCHGKQQPTNSSPIEDNPLPDLIANFLDPATPITAEEASRAYQQIMRGT